MGTVYADANQKEGSARRRRRHVAACIAEPAVRPLVDVDLQANALWGWLPTHLTPGLHEVLTDQAPRARR
jgi:macrodomain Ter protein organizer (MatP/YcbG family)